MWTLITYPRRFAMRSLFSSICLLTALALMNTVGSAQPPGGKKKDREADPAKFSDVPDSRHADNQGRKHERHDDHQEEIKK